MKRSLWGLAAGLALMLMGPAAWAGDLKVSIEGVRSSAGAVMIGLYDSPEHFNTAIDKAAEVGTLNDEARLGGVALRAIAGTQSVVFTKLNPGSYAVIVLSAETGGPWARSPARSAAEAAPRQSSRGEIPCSCPAKNQTSARRTSDYSDRLLVLLSHKVAGYSGSRGCNLRDGFLKGDRSDGSQ
jgi:uncharacterized protein (DUF2141 family)